MIPNFKVIDKITGLEADPEKIALNEDWANCLLHRVMLGFAILQTNINNELLESERLILVDEYGQNATCPPDRFEVVFDKKGESL
jgi:hypothetical protein